MGLTEEEQAIVMTARRYGMISEHQRVQYLCGNQCILWALGLAPFTLGFSLILCPLVWVAQHDRTGRSIDRLRQQLAATPFAQG
jgi:hypothetical protein